MLSRLRNEHSFLFLCREFVKIWRVREIKVLCYRIDKDHMREKYKDQICELISKKLKHFGKYKLFLNFLICLRNEWKANQKCLRCTALCCHDTDPDWEVKYVLKFSQIKNVSWHFSFDEQIVKLIVYQTNYSTQYSVIMLRRREKLWTLQVTFHCIEFCIKMVFDRLEIFRLLYRTIFHSLERSG